MTSRSASRPAGADRIRPSGSPRRYDVLGTLCVVFGSLAVAAFLWLWSLTLPGFNPPNWIRIVGVAGMPIGVAGAALTAAAGHHGASRLRLVMGLCLAAVTVLAFIALVATADY